MSNQRAVLLEDVDGTEDGAPVQWNGGPALLLFWAATQPGAGNVELQVDISGNGDWAKVNIGAEANAPWDDGKNGWRRVWLPSCSVRGVVTGGSGVDTNMTLQGYDDPSKFTLTS